MRESTKDIEYIADEALEVLIESVVLWRKEVRRKQRLGAIPSEYYSRQEWLSHFVGWLSEREGPL